MTPADPGEPRVPQLPVVYQDEDIVVIDKPVKLMVHEAANSAGSTVVDYARSVSSDPDPDRPGIVHRLDRDTSGLLIIAKTAAAKQQLQQQFKDRRVKKTYLLLVHGYPEPAAAILRLPIGRAQNPTQRLVSQSGRMAETKYHTLERLTGFSLVEAQPLTGRTHQLRVHFKHIGHPIVGDQLYGHEPNLGLKRQFLHATRLEFTAPGGDLLKLESPLPLELQQVLEQLRKRL
jgi:23S rRNA pseudouridine1911/1915/1917 synthase